MTEYVLSTRHAIRAVNESLDIKFMQWEVVIPISEQVKEVAWQEEQKAIEVMVRANKRYVATLAGALGRTTGIPARHLQQPLDLYPPCNENRVDYSHQLGDELRIDLHKNVNSPHKFIPFVPRAEASIYGGKYDGLVAQLERRDNKIHVSMVPLPEKCNHFYALKKKIALLEELFRHA